MSKLYLIKPTRSVDGKPCLLSQDYINQNSNKGIETNIFLDLNILSRMMEVVEGKKSYKDTFLPEFVALFQNLRGYYLSPGLALQEAYGNYKQKNYDAFETFLRKFLPNCQNAYNAI